MEPSKVSVQLLFMALLRLLNILVFTTLLGVTLASQRAIGRGYAAVLMFIPALVGAILVNALSSQNKVGLLMSYWISSELGSSFLIRFTYTSNSFCIYTIRDTSRMGWIHCGWSHKAYVHYEVF
jgi:hypothetical protein